MTTTDYVRIDDLSAVLDLEREVDISTAGSPLPDLSLTDAAPPVSDGRGVNKPECRSTRAALHDYLNRRLASRRQHRLETHMYGCAACIRVFIDIREVAWRRRAAGSLQVAASGPESRAGAHNLHLVTGDHPT